MKNCIHVSLFSLTAALCSCATVLNHPYEQIEIQHDTSITRLWINGTAHSSGDTTILRSSQDLLVVAETRSGLHSVRLSSNSSFAYWLNAIYTFGLGMYLERDAPERWTYPSTTYLRLKDGVLEEWRHAPRSPGSFRLNFALPYINWFDLEREDGKTSRGFIGAELGLAYYVAENANVSVNVGAATDFFAPMGPVMIVGPWRSTSIGYVDLRTVYLTDRLEVGGGLSIASVSWKIKQDTVAGRSRGDDQALAGLNLTTGYRLGNRGRIAVVYHPYFLRMNDKVSFSYQHHISLGWSVELGGS